MAKRKKYIPQKHIAGLREEETSSELIVHPDATLSPSTYETPTAIDVIQRESTSAPAIGEEDAAPYVESFAGLADKYIFSKRSIPFNILLLICGVGSAFIFIHDNNAGLLVDFNAVYWTLKKCFILCTLIVLIWVALSIVAWIKSKINRT